MSDKKNLQKAIKRAIFKLKNGSASSEDISLEFATAIETYIDSRLPSDSKPVDS